MWIFNMSIGYVHTYDIGEYVGNFSGKLLKALAAACKNFACPKALPIAQHNTLLKSIFAILKYLHLHKFVKRVWTKKHVCPTYQKSNVLVCVSPHEQNVLGEVSMKNKLRCY